MGTEYQFESGTSKEENGYCCGLFLQDSFFKQWYRKTSATFKKLIFKQDNTVWLARKGIKDGRMITWTSSSPDPSERFSSVKQDNFTSVTMLWKIVVAASARTST